MSLWFLDENLVIANIASCFKTGFSALILPIHYITLWYEFHLLSTSSFVFEASVWSRNGFWNHYTNNYLADSHKYHFINCPRSWWHKFACDASLLTTEFFTLLAAVYSTFCFSCYLLLKAEFYQLFHQLSIVYSTRLHLPSTVDSRVLNLLSSVKPELFRFVLLKFCFIKIPFSLNFPF